MPKLTKNQATILDLILKREIWVIDISGKTSFHWNGAPIPDGGKRFVDQLARKDYIEIPEVRMQQKLIAITEKGQEALFEFNKTERKLASKPIQE